MTHIDLKNHRWIYIRNKNRFGDDQGILFDRKKDWDTLKVESQFALEKEDFPNLIKTICDLRGVHISELPISMDEITMAIESMRNDAEKERDSLYTLLPSGILEHKKTKTTYIAASACSLIIKKNEDAVRPSQRKYRSGITAAKAVIRSMTPIGYWKMARLDSSVTTVEFGDSALSSAADDFLVQGPHHKVKGTIPTEVFQIARKFSFEFRVPDSLSI